MRPGAWRFIRAWFNLFGIYLNWMKIDFKRFCIFVNLSMRYAAFGEKVKGNFIKPFQSNLINELTVLNIWFITKSINKSVCGVDVCLSYGFILSLIKFYIQSSNSLLSYPILVLIQHYDVESMDLATALCYPPRQLSTQSLLIHLNFPIINFTVLLQKQTPWHFPIPHAHSYTHTHLSGE